MSPRGAYEGFLETSVGEHVTEYLEFFELDAGESLALVSRFTTPLLASLQKSTARTLLALVLGGAIVRHILTTRRALRIEGAIVLVNGAASTVGAEVCKALACQGASVILVGPNQQSLDAVRAQVQELKLAPRSAVLAHNSADPSAAQGLVQRARSLMGLPDVIIHCQSGGGPDGKQGGGGEGGEEEEDGILSAALVAKAFLPGFVARRAGIILALSHTQGAAAPRSPIQNAAASAIQGLSRALAADVQGTGVEVQEVVLASDAGAADAAKGVVDALQARRAFTFVRHGAGAEPKTRAILTSGDAATHAGEWITHGSPAKPKRPVPEANKNEQTAPKAAVTGKTASKPATPLPAGGVDGGEGGWDTPTPVKGVLFSNRGAAENTRGQREQTAPKAEQTAPKAEQTAPKAGAKSKAPPREAPMPKDDNSAKAGLGVVLSQEWNGVQIVRVEHDSPASLCEDLSLGDLLVSINGTPTAKKHGDELLALLRGPPESEVLLVVKSKGKLKTLQMERSESGKDSAWLDAVIV